jgi:hypothetical protein
MELSGNPDTICFWRTTSRTAIRSAFADPSFSAFLLNAYLAQMMVVTKRKQIPAYIEDSESGLQRRHAPSESHGGRQGGKVNLSPICGKSAALNINH